MLFTHTFSTTLCTFDIITLISGTNVSTSKMNCNWEKSKTESVNKPLNFVQKIENKKSTDLYTSVVWSNDFVTALSKKGWWSLFFRFRPNNNKNNKSFKKSSWTICQIFVNNKNYRKQCVFSRLQLGFKIVSKKYMEQWQDVTTMKKICFKKFGGNKLKEANRHLFIMKLIN